MYYVLTVVLLVACIGAIYSIWHHHRASTSGQK
jgi:hypothetical protein